MRTTPGPNVPSQPGPCLGRTPDVGDSSEDAHPTITLSMFTHSVRTRSNAVKFAHQFLCSPKVSSLLKAVRRGFLNGCPNMSAELILKYLNPSAATAKGHMKRPRYGIRSTRTWTPVETMTHTYKLNMSQASCNLSQSSYLSCPNINPSRRVLTSSPTTRTSPSLTSSALEHSQTSRVA